MRLTELTIKRPAMTSMVFLLFVFLGSFCAPFLNIDLYPKANVPYVVITVIYPGASPDEIESRVAEPIEDSIASVSKIKKIHTICSENLLFIAVEFLMSAEPETAVNDVRKAVDTAKSKLPKESESPSILKVDLNSEPVITMAMSGNQRLEDIYDFAKEEIKPRVEQLPGVAQVTITGGKEREIKVFVDRNKLEHYGLTLGHVVQSLGMQNLTLPAGKVNKSTNEYLIRASGEFKNLEEIRNLSLPLYTAGQVMLKSKANEPFVPYPIAPVMNGGNVRLRDLARIEYGYKDIENFSRLGYEKNGRTYDQEAVALSVQKQGTASTTAVAEEVINEVARLQTLMPPGVKIEVVRDSSVFVKQCLEDTWRAMFEGILITGLVLYLFLREWRSTLIVGLSIPTSLVSTFIMMYFGDFSFNVLTLLALTMVIGILVDDSIVVLENIHRHRTKFGKRSAQAALDGRTEIGMAAVAITMSDVVVFGPVSFMTGMIGQFFKEFGLTVVFSTLFSLLVSFTLTPMMSAMLFKDDEAELEREERQKERERVKERGRTWWGNLQYQVGVGYKNLLYWSMEHRLIVFIICMIAPMSIFATIPMGVLQLEFIPKTDYGQMTVNLDMPPGTSLDETQRTLQIIQKRLLDKKNLPEVRICLTTVGQSAEDYFGVKNPQTGSILVKMYEKNDPYLDDKNIERRPQWEVAQWIRENIAPDLAGAKIAVFERSGYGRPLMAPIMINVAGPKEDKVEEIAEAVRKLAKDTKGAMDVDSTWREGQPEMQWEIDRPAAEHFGVTSQDIAWTLRCALTGQIATKYRVAGQETDIRVQMDGAKAMEASELGSMAVMNPVGQIFPLGYVANMVPSTSSTEVRRLDRKRAIMVRINLNERPLGPVAYELNKKTDEIHLPPGYSINYEGEYRDLLDSFEELSRALIISVILVYAILVMLYESYLVPVVRMLSLPLGAVGAFGALLLTGRTFNIISFIGLIMLDGLVAKNSTLLIDYTHTIMQRERIDLRDALVKAGTTRLRPIVMTTVTMMAGMLPTAIANTTGSEIRSPMAISLIGGLTISTLLTLVVIPVAYTWLHDMRVKVKGEDVDYWNHNDSF
ncbi:MAG: efflux RND transporter permease subunit [Acidobacteriota bacterium]